jgi:hypothetical protein
MMDDERYLSMRHVFGLLAKVERTAIAEKFSPIFRLILHNLLIPAGIYL